LSIGFSQSYDFKKLTLNKEYLKKYAQTIAINKSVSFEKTTRAGEGVTNMELFNNWAPLFPILAPQEMPDGWILQSLEESQKSEDAYVGNFAMHIESTYHDIDDQGNQDLFGGLGAIGNVEIDMIAGTVDVTQGEPFTERPSSMTFAVKGNLIGFDTAIILFQSTLNGTQIIGSGVGLLGADDVTDEYQIYTIPIAYETTISPDTIQLIATSSGVGLFGDPDTGEMMDIGTLTEGSYIVVDNIVLNYTNDNTNEIEFYVENKAEEALENVKIDIYTEDEIITTGYTNEEGILSFNLNDGTFDYIVSLEDYDNKAGSFVAENQEEPIMIILEQTEENNVEGSTLNIVSLYPNPTNGLLTIENVNGAKVEIFNMIGKTIAVFETTDKDLRIDLSNYNIGTYIIKVDNKVHRINLVK